MTDELPRKILVDGQSFVDLIQASGALYKLCWWLVENDQVDISERLAPIAGNIRTLILAISEGNNLINDEDIERLNKPLYDALAYLRKVEQKG